MSQRIFISVQTLAYWLHRLDFKFTIVERRPSMCSGRQNIDIKSAAQKIAGWRDIEDDIHAADTGELATKSPTAWHLRAMLKYSGLIETKRQQLTPGVPMLANPRSAFVISLFNAAIRLIYSRFVRKLGKGFSGKKKTDDDGIKLTDYQSSIQ